MINYINSTNLPCAWITNPKDRGRKSIKGNVIYLNNGQEFQIELFNPLNVSVKAEIQINSIQAAEGGIVIRPGERFYLDCFTANRKKFTFNTYSVENKSESLKAIKDNGKIEIKFYKEIQSPQWFGWAGSPWYEYYGNGTCAISGGGVTSTPTYTYPTSNIQFNSEFSGPISSSVNYCSTIETGRIEGGSQSSQKFTSVSMDFEYYPVSSVIYQILPESRKPIESSEIRKKFCTNCGRKLKESFKFCPDCGLEA